MLQNYSRRRQGLLMRPLRLSILSEEEPGKARGKRPWDEPMKLT